MQLKLLTIHNGSKTNSPMIQTDPLTRAYQIDAHGMRRLGSRQKLSQYWLMVTRPPQIFLMKLK